jgi:hypothetical protein
MSYQTEMNSLYVFDGLEWKLFFKSILPNLFFSSHRKMKIRPQDNSFIENQELYANI